MALFVCIFCNAQENESKKDVDSSDIYSKIERFSKKAKFTKMVHKLIFRSSKKSLEKKPKLRDSINYKRFDGKIIRNVIIDVKDPFGFSFKDSTERANSFIEKFGNQVHIKSKKFTIRSLLLFKEGQALDPLLVKESERLVRSQNYIRSLRIHPKIVGVNKDSVDLKIQVLDAWSLIPQGDISTSRTSLRIKERNFLGFGHQFNSGVNYENTTGDKAYNLQYRVTNFKNTFINTTLGYRNNLKDYASKFIDIRRDFFSPLTRWAGGIHLDEQFYEDRFNTPANDSLIYQNIKTSSLDVWGAIAFPIFKGQSEDERTTNLIASMRVLDVNYKERPSSDYDPIAYYSNELFFLGTVGISSRQFVKDNYIFQDGFTEDVPVGTIYAMTAGSQKKSDTNRLYLGLRVAHGQYFDWGYISTNLEYGTYFRDSYTEQTTYSFQANYFTKLIPMGSKWKMRQFVKPQFLIGVNRLNTTADRVSLDENREFDGFNNLNNKVTNEARIPGFNSDILGTKKYVLALQTQFYSPWEVLGFRLNPFVNLTGGFIENEQTSIAKSKLFSSVGIGFIIRNDYLVFSNFQISLAFYPNAPILQNNFKTNAFETEDFGFQSFELGKPLTVEYN